MKKSLFRPQHRFFHLNIDFQIHPIFKELDWIFIQKKIHQHLQLDQGLQVHALVMMDTHIHLLIQTSQPTENYFCEHLRKALGKNPESNECHCEPIKNFPQFINTYKYIYRNPVEAGLAQKAEDYAYSSIQNLLGQKISHCPFVDHLGLIQNPLRILNWLNGAEDFRFSKLQDFNEFTESASLIRH